MDSDSRVALAEIKGDVKLILAGQERTHHDVQEIRKTLDQHNKRIAGLETDKSVRDGERKGMTLSGRLFLSIGSFLVGSGGVLAVLELLK